MTGKVSPASMRKSEIARLEAFGIVPLAVRIRNGVPVAEIDSDQAVSIVEHSSEWQSILGSFIVLGRDVIPGTSVEVQR